MYRKTMVGGIALHIYRQKVNPGSTIVFMLHYFGGKARGFIMNKFCRDVARLGFTAISFDQRNHGQRKVDGKRNNGWKKGDKEYFFSLIVDMYSYLIGTSQDISFILDLLPARLGLPVNKVGVAGISLGGHSAILSMTNESRISAGAAIMGSGDFYTLMRRRWKNYGYEEAEFDGFYDKHLSSLVDKYDPIRNVSKLSDRRLLLLNGTSDDLVPIECNRNFIEEAGKQFGPNNLVELHEYQGAKHALNFKMWDEAKKWLSGALGPI
jgi:dienelactone hydrolase